MYIKYYIYIYIYIYLKISLFHLYTCKMIVCSYHVTCAFQSESTLYSSQNVNELLAQSRCGI